MMKAETKKRLALAKKKKDYAKKLLEKDNDLRNVDIRSILQHKFGSYIDDVYLARIRAELGITGGTLRHKAHYKNGNKGTYDGKVKGKKKRGVRRGKITKDDVIVLQKCCDIPEDMREVMQFTVEYMQDVGISYLELHDDGKMKIKLQQEIETTV